MITYYIRLYSSIRWTSVSTRRISCIRDTVPLDWFRISSRGGKLYQIMSLEWQLGFSAEDSAVRSSCISACPNASDIAAWTTWKALNFSKEVPHVCQRYNFHTCGWPVGHSFLQSFGNKCMAVQSLYGPCHTTMYVLIVACVIIDLCYIYLAYCSNYRTIRLEAKW